MKLSERLQNRIDYWKFAASTVPQDSGTYSRCMQFADQLELMRQEALEREAQGNEGDADCVGAEG